MWQLHNGKMVKLAEGFFLQPMLLGSSSPGPAACAELGEHAQRWIMQQLPLFAVPYEVPPLLPPHRLRLGADPFA